MRFTRVLPCGLYLRNYVCLVRTVQSVLTLLYYVNYVLYHFSQSYTSAIDYPQLKRLGGLSMTSVYLCAPMIKYPGKFVNYMRKPEGNSADDFRQEQVRLFITIGRHL